MENSSDLPVIVGAFVTIIAGFYGIAKMMLKQASRDREADRQERLKLAMAIEQMAASSHAVAEATVKAANEAKERNGHLGEQTEKIAKLVSQGNVLTGKLIQAADKAADKVAEVKESA